MQPSPESYSSNSYNSGVKWFSCSLLHQFCLLQELISLSLSASRYDQCHDDDNSTMMTGSGGGSDNFWEVEVLMVVAELKVKNRSRKSVWPE